MNNTAVPIVVIAYNRPKSLRRLLNSIAKAIYPDIAIPLIISIDYSETNKEVLQIAQDFKWGFGEKTIRYSEVNLGLRKHVLQCGNFSMEYGHVILLEDDLYVSPYFYNYTIQALKFSADRPNIGGISLYNHQFNVHTGVNFSPIEDGYDNWYFQFASSWGQAWTKKQWSDFSDWYMNQGIPTSIPDIPENVTSWSEKSWLKYFIIYLIEKDRFFLYPKVSLSTNFSDIGTHATQNSSFYQVPLLHTSNKEYHFSDLIESQSVYDAFYENINLFNYLPIDKENLNVDLHGYKTTNSKKYLLTSKILDYKIINTFGRCLKPVDYNIIQNIEGKDIFLYDTSQMLKNKATKNKVIEITYNIKNISIRNAWILLSGLIKQKIMLAFDNFKIKFLRQKNNRSI